MEETETGRIAEIVRNWGKLRENRRNWECVGEIGRNCEKLGEIVSVWCPTQILHSYHQIPYRYPFNFKSHNPASRSPLDNYKKLCYNIYNEKYAFAAARSFPFYCGKLFIAAQMFAALIYITPVPFHDSVSIVKYLLFYFTIIL